MYRNILNRSSRYTSIRIILYYYLYIVKYENGIKSFYTRIVLTAPSYYHHFAVYLGIFFRLTNMLFPNVVNEYTKILFLDVGS